MAIRGLWTLPLACFAALEPGHAVAAPIGGPPLELEWSAPSGCPSEEEVKLSIARRVQRVPPGPDALAVRVRVDSPVDGIWKGVVETRSGAATGTRTLEAESCRALAESTALIVALMLDPTHALGDPAPRAPTAPDRAERSTVVARPTRAAPRRVHALLGAHVDGSAGVLPSPAYGAGIMAGVALSASTVEVSVSFWPRRRRALPGVAPAAGANVALLAASVSLCPGAPVGPVELGGCAVAALGRFDAEGFGLEGDVAARTRWLAVGAGAFGRLRVTHRLALSVRLGVLRALDRPRFVARLAGTEQLVYQPSPASAQGLVGGEVRF